MSSPANSSEAVMDDVIDADSSANQKASLFFLAWTFLKIGSTAFGGFMALISVVQTTIVERRKLLSTEEMLDGISLATLLPGPVAVNVVAYVGYKLRGGIGAVVCATAVILPSFLLLVGFTIAYLKWGEIPAVDKAIAGFIPAVTAIIINAAWGMRGKALKGAPEVIMAIVSGVLLITIGGFYLTLGIVLGAGVLGYLLFNKQIHAQENITPLSDKESKGTSKWVWAISIVLLGGFLALFLVPIPGINDYLEAHLFVTFSGMSLMLFGGGFVFIPLIQEIVVEGLKWVNQSEFTSAIALGQITPGPILISATFIGYKVAGLFGAFIATFAIFFPPALLMVTASRVLEKIKHSVKIQSALRGIRAAVVGLIFTAAIVIGKTAVAMPINVAGYALQVPTWASIAIFIGSLFSLIRLRVDVVWIIPCAGLLGLALY